MVYIAKYVEENERLFWHCERTPVDHVSQYDSRQQQDSVSNRIKILTCVELSHHKCLVISRCRTALMKSCLSGRWFTGSYKRAWFENSRQTSPTATFQINCAGNKLLLELFKDAEKLSWIFLVLFWILINKSRVLKECTK